MKRTAGIALVLLLLAGALYLALWPVPIDPLAWEPSPSPPLAGPYAPNRELARVERLDVSPGAGPEDVAVDGHGRIYAGLESGTIVRFRSEGGQREVFAETEGRPLGLHFDGSGRLIVADAKRGLLAIDPRGEIRVLTDAVEGRPLSFADDVDVAADGRIYFSEASTRFGIEDYRLDFLESRPNGRLLVYDPQSGETRVLLDGLYFANGVAVSPDQSFVLVNETSRYRVRRYWLAGPRAGEHDVFIENLPGFPDGISSNGAGVFWLPLITPRNAALDWLSPRPFLRKVMLRLPKFLQPQPARHAFVLGLDLDGRVVHNLQDPEGERFATVTSVQQHGDRLYLGSLTEPALATLPLD